MLIKILRRTLILFIICILLIVLAVTRPTFTLQEEDLTNQFVSAEKLKEHVIYLSDTISPRSSQFPENLNKAADYIKQNFEQSSEEVSFQDYLVNGETYKNVIAHYGPNTDESIIIGAHYDVFSELPGADDNASGVAGLIELGELLKTQTLKTRITLIAYSLEEPPHFATQSMGSYIHAESVKNHNIKLMISLEMIGYISDKAEQTYPIPLMDLYYPKQGNFIAVVDKLNSNNATALKTTFNRFTDIPAYSINAPAQIPGIDFSDHRNYWAFGIPAVMVTDTSFYRNKAYHTPEDTYDRLNYEAMAKAVYGVYKYIEKIN